MGSAATGKLCTAALQTHSWELWALRWMAWHGDLGETARETGRGCSVGLSGGPRRPGQGLWGASLPSLLVWVWGGLREASVGDPHGSRKRCGVIRMKAVLRPLAALELPGSFGWGTWGR